MLGPAQGHDAEDSAKSTVGVLGVQPRYACCTVQSVPGGIRDRDTRGTHPRRLDSSAQTLGTVLSALVGLAACPLINHHSAMSAMSARGPGLLVGSIT